MQSDEIRRLIESGIPVVHVEVTGDGQHFDALVVSEAFAGKTAVQQHQMVYRALGGRMGAEIHALSMQTLTPEQWEKKKALRVV